MPPMTAWNRKSWGGDEHEGELQGLRDAGDHAGGHARDHQGLDLGLFLLGRGAVDGQRRRGQAEHHHGHLALAQEDGEGRQLAEVHLVHKLEEDVQTALHALVHAADGRGAEDAVQDVVEATRKV